MIVLPRRRLVAGALTLLGIAGMTTAAPSLAGSRQALPSNAVITRVAAADTHPGLPAACLDDPAPRYRVEQLNRIWAGRTQLAVVQLSCSNATGSTGSELSVYRPVGHTVRRSYVLFRGAESYGNQTLLVYRFTTFGRHVRVTLGGYRANDATCCPSFIYRQTSLLSVASAQRGRIKQDRVVSALPSNAKIARLAQALPHPALDKVCSANNTPRYHVDRIARLDTGGGRRIAVVQLTCRYATAGSPVELAVYAALNNHLGRRYILFRGDETRADQFLDTQRFSLTGRHLRVILSGTSPNDALCCPSHWYRQTSLLSVTTFDRGKLKPTSAPH